LLCQELPPNFKEKFVAFPCHVTALKKINNYVLHHIENADEMPVYFDMLSNYTTEDVWAQCVVIKTWGDKKM
jgi:hypothetical protein